MFYDRMQETPPYAEVIRRHADETGAIPAADVGELLSRVEVVISCVTGAMAVSVAEEAAPFLRTGSPLTRMSTRRRRRSRRQSPGSWKRPGPQFVDAAMMGAIPTFLHRVPILASGERARTLSGMRCSPTG